MHFEELCIHETIILLAFVKIIMNLKKKKMEISYLAEQAIHSQRYWLLPLTACSLCLLFPVLRLTNLLCHCMGVLNNDYM